MLSLCERRTFKHQKCNNFMHLASTCLKGSPEYITHFTSPIMLSAKFNSHAAQTYRVNQPNLNVNCILICKSHRVERTEISIVVVPRID